MSGGLFLTLDRPEEWSAGNPDEWKKHHGIAPIPDVARRRVELSAKDTTLGLKVHREALVTAPADASECDDYPHADVDRYPCLYLREYLRDSDNDSILEQLAIAHMPGDIGLASWGSPNEHDRDVRARMKVDYIRIYQPRYRYRDREPVYE